MGSQGGAGSRRNDQADIANGAGITRFGVAPPERRVMIYIVAALLPPIGLLVNGQPFSALLNLALIVPCVIFGIVFHVLLLVPSIHAVVAVHMKREQRRHREIVDAIERHGAPPWYRP
jgi:hypothetical protein